MVSAIYASNLDVLVTSGAAKLTRQHWCNLLDFSGTSQSHCAQASATVLSQDQVRLSLEGAMWSFLSTIRNLAYTVLRVLSRGQGTKHV